MEMNRLKNGVEKKEGDVVSQSSSIHRRKKNSVRRRPSNGYLQEWVHQSRSFMAPTPQYDPQYSPIVGPYWEVAGSPRMFAAFSDPSVCRYSVPTAPPPPLTYSYEPVSLPIYQTAYQTPVPPPGPVGPWRSPQHVPKRSAFKPEVYKQTNKQTAAHSSKRSTKTASRQNLTHPPSSHHPVVQGSSPQEEYLSLPPGTQHDCDLDDSHRRFSDPGLARSDTDPVNNGNVSSLNNNLEEEQGSGEWSHGSSSSSAGSANYETVALSEQLNLLKADNKRLAQELRDTRAELHKLKLQAATWGNPIQQDYQPGMIADLVREIRDAAQLREETLLSRLRLMMNDGGVLRLTGCNALEKENPSSVHNRESNLSNQESLLVSDKDADRIARLERQLNSLQIHNGSEASRREDQLRRELLEAQAARRMAESNVNKLEKLMNMMRKKMNGVTAGGEVDRDQRDVDQQPPSGSSGSLGPVGLASASPISGLTPAPSSPAPSSLESLTSATSACSSNPGGTVSASSPQGAPGPVTDL